MKTLALQISVSLVMATCFLGSLHAQDQTVSGNLTVTGTVDIAGNALYLGTHVSTPNNSGWMLSFADGTISTINFSATQSANLWQWQQNGIGTPSVQMSLSGSNTLTLFDQSVPPVAKVVITPTGTSSFANSLTLNGNDNEMPNQTMVGANSILTKGLADARYIQFDSNGYVGIGTATPMVPLEVAGNALVRGQLQAGIETDGGISAIFGQVTTSDPKQLLIQNYPDSNYIQLQGYQQSVGANQNIVLQSQGGNVGIGITTPAAALQVVSPPVTTATMIVGDDLGVTFSSGVTGFVVGNATNSTFMYIGQDGNHNLAMGWMYDPDVNSAYGVIATYGGNNPLEIGFDPNTSVGIYTHTPQSKFDVNGNVSIGAYGGTIAAPSNGLIVSGAVGIGTATPAAQLEVNGDAKIDGGLSASGTATISGTVIAPAFITTSATGDIPMYSGH